MIRPSRLQTHEAVGDHYDELDPIYRRLWGEHVHHGLWRTGRETPAQAVIALSDLVAEKLAFRAGDRLTDIGCGYGATARLFASRGAQVTGFTLSAEQLAHAPAAERVTLLRRDWLANDLPDASFDAAYAIESSEHMADKARFFAEAFRVLRPRGRLVICAWLANPDASAWQVRHLLEPICREGRLPSMLTADEYRAEAAAAGFAEIGYEDVSKAVARTWTICLRRFAKAMVMEGALRREVWRMRNREFALSVPRLVLAYRSEAMRYGVFAFERAQ